ncbi:MAG: hypothetical protein JWN70_3564, partial [Planctomycetaceae bacterium]|nr:hypothetical protein [Planctomycetaceae bacterium]
TMTWETQVAARFPGLQEETMPVRAGSITVIERIGRRITLKLTLRPIQFSTRSSKTCFKVDAYPTAH